MAFEWCVPIFQVLFKSLFASVSVSLTPFTDSLLVVGIIGVGSAVTLLPITFILDYTGVEHFVMPPEGVLRSYGIVAMLMAVYQTCLLAAIALTTPTFVATGSMITVPASMFFDYFMHGYVVPPLSQLGIIGIVGAFGLLFVSPAIDSYAKAATAKVCNNTSDCCSARAAPAKSAGHMINDEKVLV